MNDIVSGGIKTDAPTAKTVYRQLSLTEKDWLELDKEIEELWWKYYKKSGDYELK